MQARRCNRVAVSRIASHPSLRSCAVLHRAVIARESRRERCATTLPDACGALRDDAIAARAPMAQDVSTHRATRAEEFRTNIGRIRQRHRRIRHRYTGFVHASFGRQRLFARVHIYGAGAAGDARRRDHDAAAEDADRARSAGRGRARRRSAHAEPGAGGRNGRRCAGLRGAEVSPRAARSKLRRAMASLGRLQTVCDLGESCCWRCGNACWRRTND